MAEKKYYYRKLIRDKIPEFIRADKGAFKTKVLGGEEFEHELNKKLVEEAKEVGDAPKEKIATELADVLELIKSIAGHHEISFKEIERQQSIRRKLRGAFKKKLFLVWSTGKPGK